MKYVYLVESDGFYKVGVATDLKYRIGELQTGNPHKINLVASCKIENAHGAERCIHLVLSKFNVRGEWFRLLDKDVEIIKDVFCSIGIEENVQKDARPKWAEILDRVRG